jgi:hypothetical protein
VQKRGPTQRARIAAILVALPAALLGCFVAARADASDPAPSGLPASPAPPAPVSLDWRGPEDCQAAPRVLAEVRRLLEGERAVTSLVARVKVGRTGRRWHLVLTTERHGHAAVRQIDAESCGAAADATAVILALTINPSRALADDDEDASAGAAAAPSADAAAKPLESALPLPPGAATSDGLIPETPDAPPAAEEDAGAPVDFPLFLIATLASDTGTLPRTGFGFRGGLGVGAGLFRMEAQMAYWPTVSTQIAGPAGAPASGGSFTMLVADLRACVLGDVGPFSLGPCAGGGITSMQAEGFGVTTPIAGGANWGSLAADALVRVRISRYFSPRLDVGAAIPLARPAFDVQGLGPVHRPAAIALQIGVGMELHF